MLFTIFFYVFLKCGNSAGCGSAQCGVRGACDHSLKGLYSVLLNCSSISQNVTQFTVHLLRGKKSFWLVVLLRNVLACD